MSHTHELQLGGHPLPQRRRYHPHRPYSMPELLRNLKGRESWQHVAPNRVPLAKAPERSRVDLLEQELAAIKERLASLESRSSPCNMEIRTFAPTPYQVKKPIPIAVRPHDGVFLASFMDANVNASGETEQEAFEAVKMLMLDMLEQLESQPKLGPKLAVRLAVLKEFVGEP
jgi:hypothetical protein